MDKSQVHVEVHGATTRPSVTVQWKGNRAVCEFLPTESGTYKVSECEGYVYYYQYRIFLYICFMFIHWQLDCMIQLNWMYQRIENTTQRKARYACF